MCVWQSHTSGSLKYISRLWSRVNHRFLKPSVCWKCRTRERNISDMRLDMERMFAWHKWALPMHQTWCLSVILIQVIRWHFTVEAALCQVMRCLWTVNRWISGTLLATNFSHSFFFVAFKWVGSVLLVFYKCKNWFSSLLIHSQPLW